MSIYDCIYDYIKEPLDEKQIKLLKKGDFVIYGNEGEPTKNGKIHGKFKIIAKVVSKDAKTNPKVMVQDLVTIEDYDGLEMYQDEMGISITDDIVYCKLPNDIKTRFAEYFV